MSRKVRGRCQGVEGLSKFLAETAGKPIYQNRTSPLYSVTRGQVRVELTLFASSCEVLASFDAGPGKDDL